MNIKKRSVTLTNEKLLVLPPFIMTQCRAQVRMHRAQVQLISPCGENIIVLRIASYN